MRVSLVQMKKGRLRDFCIANSSHNVDKGRNEKIPKFCKHVQIPLTKFISVEELISVTPNQHFHKSLPSGLQAGDEGGLREDPQEQAAPARVPGLRRRGEGVQEVGQRVLQLTRQTSTTIECINPKKCLY